jgi:hypothetical protein
MRTEMSWRKALWKRDMKSSVDGQSYITVTVLKNGKNIYQNRLKRYRKSLFGNIFL